MQRTQGRGRKARGKGKRITGPVRPQRVSKASAVGLARDCALKNKKKNNTKIFKAVLRTTLVFKQGHTSQSQAVNPKHMVKGVSIIYASLL